MEGEHEGEEEEGEAQSAEGQPGARLEFLLFIRGRDWGWSVDRSVGRPVNPVQWAGGAPFRSLPHRPSLP